MTGLSNGLPRLVYGEGRALERGKGGRRLASLRRRAADGSRKVAAVDSRSESPPYAEQEPAMRLSSDFDVDDARHSVDLRSIARFGCQIVVGPGAGAGFVSHPAAFAASADRAIPAKPAALALEVPPP